MKRTAKRTFGTIILLTLLCIAFVTIASAPVEAKPNLDFSEGCLRGYLWDASILHIACGVYGSGLAVPAAQTPEGKAVKAGEGQSEEEQLPVLVGTPAPRPPETIVTPPPAKEREKGKDGDRGDDDDKKCPKQDNVNKQGHHNCGKGPGPGEHDNGKDGKDHKDGDDHDKGNGKDK